MLPAAGIEPKEPTKSLGEEPFRDIASAMGLWSIGAASSANFKFWSSWVFFSPIGPSGKSRGALFVKY